jgi:hypothetical protein
VAGNSNAGVSVSQPSTGAGQLASTDLCTGIGCLRNPRVAMSAFLIAQLQS